MSYRTIINRDKEECFMKSHFEHLKSHYEKQKKILDALRKRQNKIAQKALLSAQNEVYKLEETINRLSDEIQIASQNDDETSREKLSTLSSDLMQAQEKFDLAKKKLKEEELNVEEIRQTIASEFNADLSHLMESTQQQIAHPAPLAVETVSDMDLTNYDKFDKFDPEGHHCMGYYRVNGRHFTLWQSEKHDDVLLGTTRSNPLYDDQALTSMYGEEYFGDKATLQVGIPDRGAEEVKRRQDISRLQVGEWKKAGIEIEGKRVVEIGGGSGYLSEEVKNQGGAPINVELCKERCDSCEERGIETYNGFLQIGVANDDNKLPYKSADVVACYDLLEHIVNPHEGFIQSVNAVLNEGGYLCVRVPEGTEPTLHLVDHVNHFSFQSLKKFLEHYGFEYVQRPEPEPGKGKLEKSGEGQRYSGTFRESGFEAKKESSEKERNKEFRERVPNTERGEQTAKHPIPERTIENMTVYFRKVRDCDYSVLDKYRITPKPGMAKI